MARKRTAAEPVVARHLRRPTLEDLLGDLAVALGRRMADTDFEELSETLGPGTSKPKPGRPISPRIP